MYNKKMEVMDIINYLEPGYKTKECILSFIDLRTADCIKTTREATSHSRGG
jgi:hypothetical protein